MTPTLFALALALAALALVAAQGLTTVRYTDTAQTDGGTALSGGASESGSAALDIDQSFAAGTTDGTVTGFTLTVANLQFLLIVADQDCTLETNSALTPVDSISLKANRPLKWSKSEGYFANPFGTNVTTLFITCATATRLRIKMLTS